MLALPVSAMELQPGTRVAVFPQDDASGCVLGHFATIVKLRRRSASLPAVDPIAWTYVVRWGTHIREVDADQILIVEPASVEGQVRFNGEPAADSDSLTGRYRLPHHSWARFEFVKGAEAVPRFELRLPAKPLSCETPALTWYVPADDTLNLDYVLGKLHDLFGTEFGTCS